MLDSWNDILLALLYNEDAEVLVDERNKKIKAVRINNKIIKVDNDKLAYNKNNNDMMTERLS